MLLDRESHGKSILPFLQRHYRRRERFRRNYQELATALVRTLDFQSLLDVGCGQGLLLEPLLLSHERDVRGIELSPAVRRFIPDPLKTRTTIGDPLRMEPEERRWDLVSSIEVAEHIREQHADRFVEFLTRSARNAVYFTAAIPGQKGRGHINLQPQFYWIRRFRARGLELDVDRTGALVDRIAGMSPATWIPQNSLIFTRTSET